MTANTLHIAFCNDPKVLGDESAIRALSACDVVVFPELVDGGYAKLQSGAVPHRINSPLVRQFKNFSRYLSAVCVAGSLHFQHAHRRPTNTSLIFRSGRIIASYDKIHLFKPTGDHTYFVPGSRVGMFHTGSGRKRVKCGVIICYDVRFPELTRLLAAEGIKILFVPARWPAIRDEAWQALLKARAVENQIFVLGCNAHGVEGGFSYAFDPLGRKVFSNRGKRRGRMHIFTLDGNCRHESRRFHDNLKEARLITGLKYALRSMLRK